LFIDVSPKMYWVAWSKKHVDPLYLGIEYCLKMESIEMLN